MTKNQLLITLPIKRALVVSKTRFGCHNLTLNLAKLTAVDFAFLML